MLLQRRYDFNAFEALGPLSFRPRNWKIIQLSNRDQLAAQPKMFQKRKPENSRHAADDVYKKIYWTGKKSKLLP